jgi:hypothetical protein
MLPFEVAVPGSMRLAPLTTETPTLKFGVEGAGKFTKTWI